MSACEGIRLSLCQKHYCLFELLYSNHLLVKRIVVFLAMCLPCHVIVLGEALVGYVMCAHAYDVYCLLCVQLGPFDIVTGYCLSRMVDHL